MMTPEQFQASLSAVSVTLEPFHDGSHHPVTCVRGELYFDEEGTFSCEHATAGPGDQRTQFALNQSISSLLIELAFELM